MNTSVVSLQDVRVAYNNHIVLDDINLEVSSGEIISIVGPNGGGKSTLLKTIMGFKKTLHGSVTIFGKQPHKVLKSGIIGYLPQNTRYDGHLPLSVFDMVALSRYSKKIIFERLTRDDVRIIDESLEKVEMQDFRSTNFDGLSGGQKQRVLIARALALKPSLLLLDEPSTGLDIVAQDSFYQLLLKLRETEGLTIILVSHDIGSVSVVVDRVACLKSTIHYHGKTSECIPTDALAKVFGKDVYFLHHDKDCVTCRENR